MTGFDADAPMHFLAGQAVEAGDTMLLDRKAAGGPGIGLLRVSSDHRGGPLAWISRPSLPANPPRLKS